MQIPKQVVNVWPKKTGGLCEAVIKLTMGSAISIFPVQLRNGKGGLHLIFPKENSVTQQYRSPILFINERAEKLIAQNVERTFRPNKSTCKEYFSEQPIQIEYYVYPKEKFDQVGTAVLEINHIFRIRDIRLIQYSSGRRNILFPERICKVDGEFESKRIIEFRENWEEIINKGIWNAYEKEMKRRNGKEETYGQVKNHWNPAGTERVPKVTESHGSSERHRNPRYVGDVCKH